MNKGTLHKIHTEHISPVSYKLKLADDEINLNDLIGKDLKLSYTGNIYCIDTGKKIKKSYGQGYSFESFMTLPECDQCIFKPELCHFAAGTCRDPEWGKSRCFKPHVIYISLTSGIKIGITRQTQVPTRWIDQGAVKAIKLCTVKDRFTSGLIEVEIAKELGDKTNWRNMLKNVYEDKDLKQVKHDVMTRYKALLEKYDAEIADDEVYHFEYPVLEYPQKISSLNFDKNPIIESKLIGIKGQYLIFESGVINIRKYQGYEVTLEY